MAAKNEAAFVDRRTEALAMVLLTSLSELTVMKAPEYTGTDLIVAIAKKKVHSFNHFGIILKGTSKQIDDPRLASETLNSLISWKRSSMSHSMPVCIFFFSMVGNQGYYAWLLEPATSAGLPSLQYHDHLDCKPLALASLKTIVAEVNRYFNDLSNVLASALGPRLN